MVLFVSKETMVVYDDQLKYQEQGRNYVACFSSGGSSLILDTGEQSLFGMIRILFKFQLLITAILLLVNVFSLLVK